MRSVTKNDHERFQSGSAPRLAEAVAVEAVAVEPVAVSGSINSTRDERYKDVEKKV